MTDRISLDEAYLQMAETWAKRSKALRKKTGAILVRDQQICSDGYNGMPKDSIDDCCELKDENGNFILTETGEMITNPLVLHAEANCLLKLTEKGGMGSKGSTLYVTMSPCPDCAKLILQAKIARVVYREEYRKTEGIEILRQYKVTVDHLPHAQD